MRTRFTILAVTWTLVAAIVAPADAWVAARGNRGAVAVGGNRCCYGGGRAAGAAVAGLAVGAVAGAAVASAARPPAVVVAPPPVVYAPPPVVYAPPPVAVGSVVYGLPAGCGAVVVNGVQYFNCGGGFYQPVYQGGGVAYQVVPPP